MGSVEGRFRLELGRGLGSGGAGAGGGRCWVWFSCARAGVYWRIVVV